MKKIIAVCITVVLLLTTTLAFATDAPAPVLNARSATTYITVENPEFGASGSGFMIGDTDTVEYVVTNHHVVEGTGNVFTVFYGHYTPVNATIAIDLPVIDLCVLKLDTPIKDAQPLTLYDGDPTKLVGSGVYALGFPGVADDLFSRSDSVINDVTMTDGIISAVKASNSFGTGERPITALQMNVSINHGNSGGPLVNERGVVVGINTIGSLEDQNLTGAICISELLNTLDEKGISYLKSSAVGAIGISDAFSATIFPITAVILTAAAVVILLAIIFIIRKRKKGSAHKTQAFNNYLSENTEKIGFDMAIYILAPVMSALVKLEHAGKPNIAVYPQNLRFNPQNGRALLLASKKQEIVNGYSAPEQYKDAQQPTFAVAVYQFGAVLYRMLTGERLPDAMSRAQNDEEAQGKIAALKLSFAHEQALLQALSIDNTTRIENIEKLVSAIDITLPANFDTLNKSGERIAMPPKKKKKIVVICVVGAVVAALSVYTAFIATSYNKACTLFSAGEFAQANELVAKLPSVTPDINSLKLTSEAGMLISDGNFDDARAKIADIKDTPTAQLLLCDIDLQQGLYLISDGKSDEGETYITSYLAANPAADKQSVDFLRGTAYMNTGTFDTAEDIFYELGDYEGARKNAINCAASISASHLENDNLIAALAAIKKYSDDDGVAATIEILSALIYEQGLELVNQHSFVEALKHFRAIEGYLDADECSHILSIDTYAELVPYLNQDIAQ
ncbi:MAG: trypsin-like peptidase domain-containing protein, partial [Christensenella sp.]